MKQSTLNPDIVFIRDVIRSGGDSVKKCYQCATCSVVCNNSPDENPFPRKEMIWTQWGLKDRLVNDPDIWLCHQCDDCSVYCPREAKPMEVLAALRKMTIAHHAVPGFFAKMFKSAGYLPILFGIPVVFLLFVLFVSGHLNIPDGEVLYSKMFSHMAINISFTAMFFLACGMAFIGGKNFWNGMKADFGEPKGETSFIGACIKVSKQIMLHSKFKECDANKSRFTSHLLVFWGFIGLLVVTALAVVSIVLYHYYPLPQTNLIKILGNVSAIAFFVGLTIMMLNRLSSKTSQSRGTFFDWVFLLDLYGVVLTGIAVEYLRVFNGGAIAYIMYFIHLVFVFFLLVYFPYSKFIHFAYRFLAMVYAVMTGREVVRT
ncbi:MAG: quinone-interacting membrane-bound oxidoreductase complex subunit QmoC [Deltaproteobacteria bacterium]|nr:quinone-interacting membrane-bound oxidoreductase complex subunit QmoC [Deltaproteobacteria bacterium]